MNILFSYSGLALTFTCFCVLVLILKFGRTTLHKVWALFNFAVGYWGIGMFLIGRAGSAEQSLFLWRYAHVGGIFISIFFYHTIYILGNFKSKFILVTAYILGSFFIFLAVINPDSIYMSKIRIMFDSIYYLEANNFLYILSVFLWVFLVAYGHVMLFVLYRRTRGIKRIQIIYFFVGMVVGFSGGITYFLPMFGINIFPIGNFTIPLYCVVVTYAILKYRLLDTAIAFTRTSIFILVYSIVLGIPFAIAFGCKGQLKSFIGDMWWIVPLITSTVLATAGPFIYLFIQRKAENRLLSDQKRYQATLKQASTGMTRIKDLKKLLNLIVYILARTVNLEHSIIYLYIPNKREFSLKSSRGKKIDQFDPFLDKNSFLVKYLEDVQAPIVYEEVKQRMHDYDTQEYKEVELKLRQLQAEVAIPIFAEKQLIAIGFLGKKKSGEMYSADDLAVFSILANQVALAIENAQFYEETKKTQAQLFQAEKMATIGTMADGLSHQINNRLHALGFIAGDVLDSIKLKSEIADQSSKEIKDLLIDITGALLKIQDNVRQGGEIVQGLLRYSREGEEGFDKVDLDTLVDASLEMAHFKIKKDQLVLIKDYPKDVSSIYGNFTQLQEVMFNIIDNAYDAITQRKTEQKEENYKGRIRISTRRTDGLLEITILDNGIGIKEEDQVKLFTPFFTTKLSSKKGTGLGLYVIKKIIEENHKGRVFMSSEYMTGTITVLKLPIVKK